MTCLTHARGRAGSPGISPGLAFRHHSHDWHVLPQASSSQLWPFGICVCGLDHKALMGQVLRTGPREAAWQHGGLRYDAPYWGSSHSSPRCSTSLPAPAIVPGKAADDGQVLSNVGDPRQTVKTTPASFRFLSHSSSQGPSSYHSHTSHTHLHAQGRWSLFSLHISGDGPVQPGAVSWNPSLFFPLSLPSPH